ncbi:MAG: AAA family ATPase [Parvibaculaceae bacterium]|nr:AAA family ATPase [Parvibaculaceae bacterium]
MPLQENFHIVTGGPGAGKTTLIERLAARGFATVEEAGRRIIREQRESGGMATHDGDRLAFRSLMFRDALTTYERMATLKGPVYFDRGLPDLMGYSRLIGAPVPEDLARAVAHYRYNRIVFVAPPWAEIYERDGERGQDFAEAVATHDAIRAAYAEAGYEPVPLPLAPVGERLDFVLDVSAQGAVRGAQSGSTPCSMPKTTGPSR